MAITDAVLTGDATLFADLDTTSGPLRVVKTADVSTDMLLVGEVRGPLPAGRAVTLRDRPLDASDPQSFVAGTWLWLGPGGHRDGQLVLAVRQGAHFRENSLWYRRPVDFSRWQAWGAIVATPVTVALDLVVVAPTELLWMMCTFEQYGPLYPFDDW